MLVNDAAIDIGLVGRLLPDLAERERLKPHLGRRMWQTTLSEGGLRDELLPVIERLPVQAELTKRRIDHVDQGQDVGVVVDDHVVAEQMIHSM